MNDVTIIYGNEPFAMLPQLLEETRALDRVRPDDTVMIKPNLVVSRKDWVGINTDPRVVEALIKALKKRGVHRISVGDGSGMGYNAKDAFQICGYHEFAKRYGIRLIDLERDRFVKKSVAIDGPFKSLEIAASVVDCDFLINVPLMKAHMEALITCSLKNLKGVMPRAMKTKFHSVNLHHAIAQLASVVNVDLIVVDGLKGDLSSETGRTPVQMDRLLIGENPVQIDSVVADMLGYAPRTIRHIAHSADAGLGGCNLDDIRVHAMNRPSKNKTFTPPAHFSKRFPCRIHADGACCTCMGNFIFSLERLKEKGVLTKNLHFLIGQKASVPDGSEGITVAVGHCAAKTHPADVVIDTCPPTAGDICDRVLSVIQR
jgi:uncharacterized protein (DUF362 family)